MYYKIIVFIVSLLCALGLLKLYQKYCSSTKQDMIYASVLAFGIFMFLFLVFYDLHLT